MGNEGSIPQQGGGEEEFEHQARAPPSSSNPPLPGATTTTQSSSKGGSRLVNAFRRTNNSSHQNNQNQNSDALASYPPPDHSIDGANDELLKDPQQQQYYHPQQQDMMYQMQQQQPQMMNQSYYSQQPQQYATAQNLPKQESGVMYQNNNNNNNNTPSTSYSSSSQPTSASKKGINFRAATGSNIINKMKNLTLTRKQQQQGGAAKEVNDWETKWDEDDDDSEEGEEAIPGNEQQYVEKLPPSESQHQPLHPHMRPGIDAGLGKTLGMEQHHAHLTASTSDSVPQQQKSQLSVEDGVEWDTGAQISLEKPNVQMFLPLLRVLGKGSFGKVVLVQKRTGKERGALFAMKILRKSHLVRRRQIERTRTERKVLSVVNHPFIMKLHYAFQSPDKLYLVLDYCPGGELFFHLSRFRRFPERVARFYSAELLLALGHLHKRGIIYRDLKPENVLLDADGHVKLGDFGLAKAGIKQPCEGATSMCGTPEYMAPEVLAQQGHGFCVDYWGLGMLVYEMMTGLPPWYTTDRSKLFRRLRSAPLDIPSYFSQSSANCVSGLLERNPRRRLGVTGVRAAMEHDFFRSISWRALYGRRVEAPIRPCEGWSPPEAVSSEQQQPPSTMTASFQTTPNNQHHNNLNLDAATANFDNTFTRMPVESDHENADNDDDDADLEELHEDTFIGFTFDDNDRNEIAAGQAAATRQRTHHYNSNANGINNNDGGGNNEKNNANAAIDHDTSTRQID